MWESNAVILHVDLDCFFAAVHVKYNPFLEGFPVIIGSDPKLGKGRGVISTCSYEARDYGLHSAMPISKAYNLCPDGIYICSGREVSFEKYHEESEKVMSILKRYTVKFQQAGIDEAYLDVTNYWKQYGASPDILAQKIRDEVREDLSLPVSIGIAETKSIAKIASDLNKPNGISIVHNSMLEEKIFPLPMRKIVGVGKKTELYLNKLNIKTIGDIGTMSRERAYSLLGDHGLFLRKVALGKNYREVGYSEGKRKSISSERTFGIDQNDWKVVIKMVYEIITKLTNRLKEKHMLVKTVSIKIRFQGYITYTRSHSLNNYTLNKVSFFNIAMKLLEEFQHSTKKVRLVGVRLSGLKSGKGQLSLIDFFDQKTYSNIPS
ncbi:MAG: DNA polymerase IV [Candidatus Hodarchaeales archaeon]|jgi:DNA polymerase IV (DinB-like DNA polymerase)